MFDIQDAAKQRILVLDGAMGTAIQNYNLTADDFGGPALEGCNEHLVLTRPDVIQAIHESYLEAGCDIVETNTFGGTPLVLAEYGLEAKTEEINRAAVRLARAAANKWSTPEQPRFVAGSIGPTTKALSVTGGITFTELIDHFYAQVKALDQEGVDYFLIETCQDTRNIKASLLAIDRLFAETGKPIPVAVSGTIEPMGTMLAGQTVEALYASLAHRDLFYIGLNCATGPEFMTDHLRSLANIARCAVACVPNAGLPDSDGNYLETPEMVAQVVERFLQQGWINFLGGCCGTHPGHIRALARLAKKYTPRKPVNNNRSFLSGIDYLEITDEMRPVLVGERTNVIGSRKFKDLICEEKFDEASEVARAQIKKGAHILDVCLANPDRNELKDMEQFLEQAVKKVRIPLMIDSTDAEVIEKALTYSQGKAIINSINLEDGEERFEEVIPLAKKYGAALVVGCIDDDPQQGMGVSRKRKLEIAERSYQLLTEKYGVLEEDIYWDPLVFPCATGDAQYVGSAAETIEGLRLIKQKYPRTKTILGISNVSFGLPNAGREVLNSVFLYHCVQAGLDLAIVNTEKLERYASIPEEERILAEDLLFNRGEDPVARFAAHFRNRQSISHKPKQELPLEERLPRYVVEGSKDGLLADLDTALQTSKPLDIINGPLMKGMDEVGRLFNANQLIVAEVLQSAEVMKAAVAHLEPHMEKTDTAKRGKILLATVKGDVHDIGKNLVEIILSNNGFEVINLGIKIPPEQLIQAIREHKPDIIGLSGLLVKSAQQMVITAEDCSRANCAPPMLVGGAALSEMFVDRKIAPAYTGTVLYAKDAMHGLDLAKTLMDEASREKIESQTAQRRATLQAATPTTPAPTQGASSEKRAAHIAPVTACPQPPDWERHILDNTPLEQIWKYINPLMLYGKHLGIKGPVVRLLGQLENGEHSLRARLEAEEPKALQIWEAVQKIKADYKTSPYLAPRGIYQFFHAHSEGNTLFLSPKNEAAQNGVRFHFPRQKQQGEKEGLCIADFAHPDSAAQDSVALFCTTVGQGMREHAEALKQKGEYVTSIALQVLALETAEAYAEYLHAQIRKAWGFADTPEMTMMDRFQAKYRGKRYSFGYPACPDLEDQKKLFTLLQPKAIGLELTEGCMMEPESSVSAIVFHHPQATYFSVGREG